ncbi:MAG: amidohydrolase family protein [Ilumatobacteraceae bacterium]|nr:amidohydrolase family protein [Ilumatobacteraceae bacterium]
MRAAVESGDGELGGAGRQGLDEVLPPPVRSGVVSHGHILPCRRRCAVSPVRLDGACDPEWWGRDRPTGRIPVETLIAKQCRMTAETVGLHDRGVLRPGFRADINVIDFDHLRLHPPVIVNDLPAGGCRMLQRATGYQYTFVAGAEIMAAGESTGATPGRLVRGAQPAPA